MNYLDPRLASSAIIPAGTRCFLQITDPDEKIVACSYQQEPVAELREGYDYTLRFFIREEDAVALERAAKGGLAVAFLESKVRAAYGLLHGDSDFSKPLLKDGSGGVQGDFIEVARSFAFVEAMPERDVTGRPMHNLKAQTVAGEMLSTAPISIAVRPARQTVDPASHLVA